MSKFTTAIVATLAVATAFPAFAKVDEGQRLDARIVSQNGETVYCVNQDKVGSLIPKRTCQTAQEWTAQGATVLDSRKAFASSNR